LPAGKDTPFDQLAQQGSQPPATDPKLLGELLLGTQSKPHPGRRAAQNMLQSRKQLISDQFQRIHQHNFEYMFDVVNTR